MSRQKRNKAIKQRHASTRLKKLEAELTRLQGGGKVTTVMDFPMRFGEGRDAHTNRITWLKSEIADLRKKTGVKKSNLEIKGFPTIDYETGKDASPAASVLNPEGHDLGIAQKPSRLGSGAFGDKYTPTEWLKKDLGPTKATTTKDPTYGTGMPSNYPGGHRGGGKVTDDFTGNVTSTATSSPAASQTSGVSELMIGNPELGLQTWHDRSKRGPKQANADTRAWLMQQGVSKSDVANVSDRALQRLRISGPTYRDNKMIRLDVSNVRGPGKSYKLKINQ